MRHLIAAAAGAVMLLASPHRASPQESAPTEYTIKLTHADLAVIGSGLSELPKKIADPMIAKFITQITEQNEAARKKVEAERPKPEAPPPQ